MYQIKDAKDRLRAEYKEKRAQIPQNIRKVYDEKICNRIMSLVSYRFSDTVLLYAAINSEINLEYLANSALACGKKLAFPRCRENGKMTFHYVTSLDDLKKGSYNIPEPDESMPTVELGQFNDKNRCLCIIPALVFDKAGHRIGYGKGYYDRVLSGGFKGTKLGVAYSDFILNTVPFGKFDMTVDLTVSEKGVILSGEN